jgi:hypothetical protein
VDHTEVPGQVVQGARPPLGDSRLTSLALRKGLGDTIRMGRDSECCRAHPLEGRNSLRSKSKYNLRREKAGARDDPAFFVCFLR